MANQLPPRRRRFLGMSCGQIALIGVLAIITLGILLVGGIYVLGDSGLIQTPLSLLSRPSASQIPADTEAITTLTPTTAPQPTEGVFFPATWTPTISPTVVRLTSTPRPTPEETPDWSSWTLMLDDIPEGFEEIPQEEINATAYEILFGSETEFATVFGYIYRPGIADDPDTITGYTVYLPTGDQRFQFSSGLDQVELLLDSIIESLNVEELFDREELSRVGEIGDASVGLSIFARIDNIDWQIEMVIFRSEEAGAVVMVRYQDDNSPIVLVEDAATALNRRIIEALIENE
jgi:hypothetical protein